MISNFVIVHCPDLSEKLINTLKAYERSKARFSSATSYSTLKGTQVIRMTPVQSIRRNKREMQGIEMKQAVEDMSRRLAELSLIVKTQDSVPASSGVSQGEQYKILMQTQLHNLERWGI